MLSEASKDLPQVKSMFSIIFAHDLQIILIGKAVGERLKFFSVVGDTAYIFLRSSLQLFSEIFVFEKRLRLKIKKAL